MGLWASPVLSQKNNDFPQSILLFHWTQNYHLVDYLQPNSENKGCFLALKYSTKAPQ